MPSEKLLLTAAEIAELPELEQRRDVEVADQDKVLVRRGREAYIVDRSALEPFVVGQRRARAAGAEPEE